MSLINGAEAILEGFGKSPPSQEHAQARAGCCLRGGPEGSPCPYNHTGGFSLTAEASRIIHSQREKKLELKLRVEGEEGLGVCKVCKCYLPLKIFFDIETLYGHTDDATLERFPPHCWLKKECNDLKHQKPQ